MSPHNKYEFLLSGGDEVILSNFKDFEHFAIQLSPPTTTANTPNTA